MALSDYFYEYVMIGTIDLAYPSNKRTFKHIAFEPDTPALIVRNIATGNSFTCWHSRACSSFGNRGYPMIFRSYDGSKAI